MTQILETPTAASSVWKWCQEAFALHGVKLTFPRNTNPQKTYQWRYVTKLAQKIDEWNLDRATAKAFINFAVDYVKERKLLHKGLSVFCQNNMMEICYKRMRLHSTSSAKRIERFCQSHGFVRAKCCNRPVVGVLLSRESFDKLRNVVRWYKTGDINEAYLAISIVCTEALVKLAIVAPDERSLLPSESELYCLAVRLSKDAEFRSQAKAVLGNDWRMLCQR